MYDARIKGLRSIHRSVVSSSMANNATMELIVNPGSDYRIVITKIELSNNLTSGSADGAANLEDDDSNIIGTRSFVIREAWTTCDPAGAYVFPKGSSVILRNAGSTAIFRGDVWYVIIEN
jgi:hypothetical protein